MTSASTASMRVYLAGPLFTEAERDFNLALAHRLEAAGYTVFLPQRDVAQYDKTPGYAKRIYHADLNGLREAHIVVAVCDGIPMDDGTAWEIGYACGRGVPVIGLRTDERKVSDEERVNLMVQESLVDLFGHVDGVLEGLGRCRPSGS